jgi:hypothetical protein
MRRFIFTTALACAGAWSCVEPVVVEERPCPCAPGYSCCNVIQLCMTPEKVAALRCTITAADAGADAMVPPDLAPPADVSVAPDAAPPAAPTACQNGGGGLQATYFRQADFTGPSVTRVEPVPVFYWGSQPPDPALGDGPWSALFSGQLEPAVSETFTFALTANGGARLWLGGELLIDWWRRPYYLPLTASVKLEAGRRYDLLIEYVDEGGDSSLALRWQSPSTHPAVIGQCHLHPAPGKASACGAGPGQCSPPGGPACPAQAGQGVRARYYRRVPVVDKEQIEPGVSVFIPGDDPALPDLVRWEGFVTAPVTGEYSFYLVTATSAQMFLKGKKVPPVVQARGDWRDGWLREQEGLAFLMAGEKAEIQVEHEYKGASSFPTGDSPPVLVHLRWKPPGGPKGIIPTCFLTPAEDP